MKTVGYSFKQAKQSKKTELLKSLASQSVGKKISKGEEINLEKGVERVSNIYDVKKNLLMSMAKLVIFMLG